MPRGNRIAHLRQRGFSLIELLVAMGILTIVLAVVFNEIDKVQKRYRTEETKLDIFQEARNFMDRFVRDLHSAGYPGSRMYQLGVIPVSPPENDSRVAAGLVSVSQTDLRFEADVDGDGQVDSIRYTLQPIGGTCPCRLRRSQVTKLNGITPLNQPTNYFSIVDEVVNSAGSGGPGPNGALTIAGNTGPTSNNTLYLEYAGSPIFQAFDRNGNPVTLPVNIAGNPQAVRSIRTIRVTLNVLATAPDPQTLQRPAVSLTASARLQN
jgi:prepilin-type N-terminal cleavage/methylation domain-containing protein